MASNAYRNGTPKPSLKPLTANFRSSSSKSRVIPSHVTGSAHRRSSTGSFAPSGPGDDGVPGRVRVAVRLRPRNAEELMADADFADCVELQPELKRLKLRKNNWDADTYEFDEVLTEFASQKRVYEVVAKPVVESVLDGYNGTVMAYGQTGTGKTFTLGHLGYDDTSARGIMVRAMEDILADVCPETDSVSVSYLQLYMETIQDLLDPTNDNIPIVEDPKTGDVSLPGATLIEVRDHMSFLELLRIGETHRIAANTKLNTESSRSHAILMIHVKRSVSGQEDVVSSGIESSSHLVKPLRPLVRRSKLVLVDLAGSERIHKSGSEGHMLEEAKGMQVAIITPFNFPLEIPVLQLMGALYMGNKPTVKVDSKVCIVMEQMIRLLHYCGLPVEDVDFINSDGKTMNKLLLEAKPRMTLFTGSSRVAEKLAVDLKGRVKLEDAGFDWKVLGPDVNEVDYVAWVCDQDAYACSGQKCSAQSILFMHENWSSTSLIPKLKDLAERRKLGDLTVGPVLTLTTDAMLDHMGKLLQISGAKLLFGGKPLENHSIPSIYGALKPTAVYIPLEEIVKDDNFELVTKEIFGPFQIITEYKKDQLPMVLDVLERMHAHLTAAVVSNDPLFLQEVVGKSVNGTTYAGLRARTTGAPQNHWFGPAGDPRGAGIGTPEAIKLVWSCHREIIYDLGPIPKHWEIPPST